MYLADMHCDSLLQVRADRGLVAAHNFSARHAQLQFCAMFVPRAWETPQERRARLIRLADTYLYETARNSLVRVDSVLELNRAMDLGLSATVLTLEGGGGLFADSEELTTLYRAGLRVLGMAWDSNELAAGAWDEQDTGLSEQGRLLAARCEERGIILDVSHLSDRAFWELCEITSTPLLATHSNFREVTPSPRNLTRDMARCLADRGGVIGLNLCPEFLATDGHATGDDILRQVDYALTLVGDRALGFGFDIDGTDGQYPEELDERESIHDRVCELLLSHYAASTVERLAGGNVTDFLKENL